MEEQQTKCSVCDAQITVTQYGQGACQNCGWYQNNLGLRFPQKVIDPNMISLNKAKRLIAAGKPLKPDFDDFLEAWDSYGEMEFSYKGKHYGMRVYFDNEIKFYEKNVKGSTQSYKTIRAFKKRAHIDGVLLSDLWDDVEDADYMGC